MVKLDFYDAITAFERKAFNKNSDQTNKNKSQGNKTNLRQSYKSITNLNQRKHKIKPEIIDQLINYIKHGKLENVKECLNKRRYLINAPDKKGYTPLHHAIYAKQIEIIRLLLSYNADMDSRDKQGITPKNLAAMKGLFLEQLYESTKRKQQKTKKQDGSNNNKKISPKTDKIDREVIIKRRNERKKIEKMKEILKAKRIIKQKVTGNYPTKKDWKLIKEDLEYNNVSKLYHFTDSSNWESIKRYGLLSWKFLDRYPSKFHYTSGANEISKRNDSRANLSDYVRLSFNDQLPQMHIAIKDGRINNPIILEIDTSVLYWITTKYSDRNATDNNSYIGSDLQAFNNIDFEIARRCRVPYYELEDYQKPYFQAEVLVKRHIPPQLIKKKTSDLMDLLESLRI